MENHKIIVGNDHIACSHGDWSEPSGVTCYHSRSFCPNAMLFISQCVCRHVVILRIQLSSDCRTCSIARFKLAGDCSTCKTKQLYFQVLFAFAFADSLHFQQFARLRRIYMHECPANARHVGPHVSNNFAAAAHATSETIVCRHFSRSRSTKHCICNGYRNV